MIPKRITNVLNYQKEISLSFLSYLLHFSFKGYFFKKRGKVLLWFIFWYINSRDFAVVAWRQLERRGDLTLYKPV